MNGSSVKKPRIAQITSEHPDFLKHFLDSLYDSSTDTYYVPRPSENLFLGSKELQGRGITGEGVKSAILDTGLMLSHPWIQRRVIESIDFTGEGAEDHNGHGTAVAFALLANAPASDLFNVKCFDRSGFATEFDLKRGLKWCVDREVRTINISGGIHDPDCHGDCGLCQTAIQVGQSGPMIVVAAGNDPNEPLCPGKAGFLSDDVHVVGAYDVGLGRPPDYSALGESYGEVGRWKLVPVE